MHLRIVLMVEPQAKCTAVAKMGGSKKLGEYPLYLFFSCEASRLFCCYVTPPSPALPPDHQALRQRAQRPPAHTSQAGRGRLDHRPAGAPLGSEWARQCAASAACAPHAPLLLTRPHPHPKDEGRGSPPSLPTPGTRLSNPPWHTGPAHGFVSRADPHRMNPHNQSLPAFRHTYKSAAITLHIHLTPPPRRHVLTTVNWGRPPPALLPYSSPLHPIHHILLDKIAPPAHGAPLHDGRWRETFAANPASPLLMPPPPPPPHTCLHYAGARQWWCSKCAACLCGSPEPFL
jgi:hypothetical protein